MTPTTSLPTAFVDERVNAPTEAIDMTALILAQKQAHHA